jgi:hypothetical protein
MARKIEITIDELILRGFTGIDRAAVGKAPDAEGFCFPAFGKHGSRQDPWRDDQVVAGCESVIHRQTNSSIGF